MAAPAPRPKAHRETYCSGIPVATPKGAATVGAMVADAKYCLTTAITVAVAGETTLIASPASAILIPSGVIV